MSEPFLTIEGVSKSFPGVQALRDVDLEAYPGEALALIGANGAGKSTLMNILGGVVEKDAGRIRLGGEEVHFRTPLDAAKRSISFVHQEMALLPSMTIAENIFVTSFPRNAISLIRKSDMERECDEIVSRLREGLTPDMRVDTLSPGDQQMVEIARALRTSPRLIIFDEPTSSLTEREKERLFDVIGRLKEDGVTIIYITHILDEVFSICERAAVLRNGESVGGGFIKDLTYQEIVRLMIGEQEIEGYFKRETHTAGETALRVSGLAREGVLNDISLDLRSGEVVGLWGLLGSGRTELVRAVVGLDPIDEGIVALRVDDRLQPLKPKEVHKRVGIITENRRFDGLLLPMTVRENMSLANLRSLIGRLGLVRRVQEEKTTQEYVEELSIKVSSIEQRCGTLSGGNQQKVIVSRWLQRRPQVFLMDEPTRGLDVGAKTEIHRIIGDLAASGAAILVITSDIDEIMALSDRYTVMHKGRIVAELPRGAGKAELMGPATGAL